MGAEEQKSRRAEERIAELEALVDQQREQVVT
jgi:hypothetical protein